MPDSGDVTISEIGRAVARLEVAFAIQQTETRTRFHELSNAMNIVVGPLSAHTIHIANQQSELSALRVDIHELTQKMAGLQTRSAFIAGGIGFAAFVAQFISNWINH